MIVVRGPGAAAATLLALLFLIAPAQAQDAETRATMADIADALGLVLPLSLSDERFGDPEQRARIVAALRRLATDGARLEAHGRQREAGFEFLSRSLARDTREILERYEAGRIDQARFLLHEMTDDCVACHARLPDDLERPLGRRLFESPGLAELPLEERVQLELATRQWDAALASYEALFASPEHAPAALDLMGQLDGYLEVALRVRRDPARARRALEQLAEREDLTRPLAETLDVWIAWLREWEVRPPAEPSLVEARRLLADARDRSRFPDDRRALPTYVATSAVLHRFVSEARRSPRELGEAYYLLGLIESRVGRSFWLSQTSHYLEAAILVAPGAPSAEQAYALLEEFTVSGYTGSAGRQVPTDVQERLDSLRALIEQERPT